MTTQKTKNLAEDYTKRIVIIQNTVKRLCHEFGVPSPKLTIKPLKTLHGFYTLDEITLNFETLVNNLGEAVRTIRHEFAHYLEDYLALPQKKSELKAKHFENNIHALGLLPKNQKKLA